MLSETFNSVVMQPITVCNLDCEYCYLPTRHLNLKMQVGVAEKVAEAIELQDSDNPVLLIWHGGEPTATGLDHFRKLIQPFERLRKANKVHHSMQTNATLITKSWCQFFIRHQFRVGVSIDGPEWANVNRVDLNGKPIYSRIMRGIKLLREHEIPFGVIAVVHEANIERPEEFYEFFCELGCDNLAINIEEIEGVNTAIGEELEDKAYSFWKRLFKAQQANPVLRIREFDSVFSYINAVLNDDIEDFSGLFATNLFPTVAWNGDVYLLSPEFGGYKEFVVGNLRQGSLLDILTAGRNVPYVVEFEQGVQSCKSSCSYYEACRGGYASNKFFEHGTTNATETTFCRNARMKLLDAVLDGV